MHHRVYDHAIYAIDAKTYALANASRTAKLEKMLRTLLVEHAPAARFDSELPYGVEFESPLEAAAGSCEAYARAQVCNATQYWCTATWEKGVMAEVICCLYSRDHRLRPVSLRIDGRRSVQPPRHSRGPGLPEG